MLVTNCILGSDTQYHLGEEQSKDDLLQKVNTRNWSLIEILPDPGFYLAGGFAGVISRMYKPFLFHNATR